jgi:signal transduction histidine kinase
MENEVDVLHNELRNIKNDLNSAIQRIREFIESVSNIQMGMDQFKMQIDESIENFKKITKAVITLDYQIPEITNRYLSSNMLTQIYYIIQEAVSNSIKHSKSSAISIKIRYDMMSVVAEVKDNGEGFDIKLDRNKRKFGISSMQERSASIGGILNIDSSLKGTTVTLIVPWEEELNE